MMRIHGRRRLYYLLLRSVRNSVSAVFGAAGGCCDGTAKAVNTGAIAVCECTPYLVSQQRFNTVEVQPDGYGVYWNEEAVISHGDLFTYGTKLPLKLEDLHRYVRDRVVSASEACEILECSRQNIDDLMHRDKLHLIRTDAKYKLFSKTEVMQRRKDR